MSLKVIAEGRHGDVIVLRRKADGTVILLACTEYISPSEASGTTIVPDSDEKDAQAPADPPKQDGVFPMLESASDQSLVIDISEMPAGILQFTPERFSRHAIAMLRNGETETALDEQSASEFGYMGVLDDAQKA